MNRPSLPPFQKIARALFLSCLAAVPAFADVPPAPAPAPAPSADDPVAIAVGKGSYASFPPHPDKETEKILNRPLFIDPSQDGKPIPTNHWWTYLINNPTSTERNGGKMWPYPLTVQANATGATIFYPTEWNAKGNDMELGPGIAVTGEGFTPGNACALNWGDWSLAIRYPQDEGHRIDLTLARGMPYAWFEFKGVAPHLALDPAALLEDATGQPLKLPAAANRIVISQGSRLFALFAPDGATFDGDAANLKVTGAQGPVPFLVVAALPSIDQLPLLTTCAYAIPRTTLFNWSYDPVKGEVATDWKIETEALQGTNKDVLQGWLPHHYRATRQNLPFTPLEYATVRGKMKVAQGQEFSIAWPFNGIPPVLPAPAEVAAQAHPFQKDRMKTYLDGYVAAHTTKSGKERYGKDTYWGGKDLTQYGLYATMADQLGLADDAKALTDTLRDALSDWFTYTPGETAQYFARYDRWKAMVGFKGSYGSEGFVDNHFHYGYFTLASALLGMRDPQFAADYGGMAKLVAKQYANWDRADGDFPLFRTFDPWAGRSYASGSGSPNGGNQESSSEAMQSWSGLFLLGVVLQDPEMTAAGAMGWSIEESSVEEYWFDYHGWKDGPSSANFPPGYGHALSGNAYDGGDSYSTFFGGQPHFVCGIQWLPLQPGLYYLGRDPKFSQYQLDSMFKEEQIKTPGFNMASLGADWGDSTLGFVQFFDPEAAVAQLDAFWDAGDPIAKSLNTAGLTYYYAHSDRQLGPVAWNCHAELPASLVYQKPGDDHLTLVAWSPSETPVSCRIFRDGQVVATVTVPGRTISEIPIPLPTTPTP